jgi:hypothetical protein
MRRRFYELAAAGEGLERIGRLYAVEKDKARLSMMAPLG